MNGKAEPEEIEVLNLLGEALTKFYDLMTDEPEPVSLRQQFNDAIESAQGIILARIGRRILGHGNSGS